MTQDNQYQGSNFTVTLDPRVFEASEQELKNDPEYQYLLEVAKQEGVQI